MWALLTVYQLLRIAMTEATATRPGTDADRACFTTVLETARDQIISAEAVIPGDPTELLGSIGRAVLATSATRASSAVQCSHGQIRHVTLQLVLA